MNQILRCDWLLRRVGKMALDIVSLQHHALCLVRKILPKLPVRDPAFKTQEPGFLNEFPTIIVCKQQLQKVIKMVSLECAIWELANLLQFKKFSFLCEIDESSSRFRIPKTFDKEEACVINSTPDSTVCKNKLTLQR